MEKILVTFDYRCPFARNATEHVYQEREELEGIEFEPVPFFLDQVHVEEGFDAFLSEDHRKNLVPQGIFQVLKKREDPRIWEVHMALFRVKHGHAKSLTEEINLLEALAEAGLNDSDAKLVLKEAASDDLAKELRDIHNNLVSSYDVFGVPTFIRNGLAVFIRLMRPPVGQSEQLIKKTLDLMIDFPELNEFKYTKLPR